MVRRPRVRPFLLGSLLLLAISVRPAMAQLVGTEFQVNSYTTSFQSHPAIAADGSGNFVVVWGSYGQDGSNYGVFGQRFNAAGLPLGSEFQVNSYTTNGQYSPTVAVDGSGTFVVVWQSFAQDGSYSGVFGQRFDSAGIPVGSEFQVNSYTTSLQWSPAVTADAAGTFVVVWGSYGQDGSNYSGVFGQRFDSSGLPLGSEFQINSYTTGPQSYPAVAVDGSGGFVVVWQSLDQDGSGHGVFGQRFDPAGLPSGSEFQVNSYTTASQSYPAVTADGSGDFVVVWQSFYEDGSSDGVFGQRFDPAGIPLGSEFQINSYTTGNQRSPAVTADGSGNFVVVWQSYSQDGSSEGVFGQRFDPVGIPVGSEFQLNTHTTSDQGNPAAAADGSGHFVVAWSSNLQDGSGNGVFGQRGTFALFADGFEAGDVCAWSAAVGGGACP